MVEVLIILYLLEVVVVLQGQAAATTIVQLLSVLTIIHSTMMLTRTTMTLLTIVLHITKCKKTRPPIGTRHFIREDKVSSIHTSNFEPLAPESDPREFYSKLRLEVGKYANLLRIYEGATPSAGLLLYQPNDSINYTL